MTAEKFDYTACMQALINLQCNNSDILENIKKFEESIGTWLSVATIHRMIVGQLSGIDLLKKGIYLGRATAPYINDNAIREIVDTDINALIIGILLDMDIKEICKKHIIKPDCCKFNSLCKTNLKDQISITDFEGITILPIMKYLLYKLQVPGFDKIGVLQFDVGLADEILKASGL